MATVYSLAMVYGRGEAAQQPVAAAGAPRRRCNRGEPEKGTGFALLKKATQMVYETPWLWLGHSREHVRISANSGSFQLGQAQRNSLHKHDVPVFNRADEILLSPAPVA